LVKQRFSKTFQNFKQIQKHPVYAELTVI